MKKLVTLFLMVAVAAAFVAAPAEAGKKKKKPARVERKVDLAYDMGSPGIPGVVGACLAAADVEGTACIDIPLGPGEVFVKVEATDASGTTPTGILAQDTDTASPGFEIFAEFCGSTPEALPISPGLPLRVSLYTVPSPTCPGVTTTGTITATLSNMP